MLTQFAPFIGLLSEDGAGCNNADIAMDLRPVAIRAAGNLTREFPVALIREIAFKKHPGHAEFISASLMPVNAGKICDRQVAYLTWREYPVGCRNKFGRTSTF